MDLFIEEQNLEIRMMQLLTEGVLQNKLEIDKLMVLIEKYDIEEQVELVDNAVDNFLQCFTKSPDIAKKFAQNCVNIDERFVKHINDFPKADWTCLFFKFMLQSFKLSKNEKREVEKFKS